MRTDGCDLAIKLRNVCYAMRSLKADVLVLAILFISFAFALMAILGPNWTVQTWTDGTKTTQNRAGLWQRCMSGTCESYRHLTNHTKTYLNTVRFSAITGAALALTPGICLQTCFALPFLLFAWFSEMSSILIFLRVQDHLFPAVPSRISVHSLWGESLWFMLAAYVSLGLALVLWGWTRQCSEPPRIQEWDAV